MHRLECCLVDHQLATMCRTTYHSINEMTKNGQNHDRTLVSMVVLDLVSPSRVITPGSAHCNSWRPSLLVRAEKRGLYSEVLNRVRSYRGQGTDLTRVPTPIASESEKRDGRIVDA